ALIESGYGIFSTMWADSRTSYASHLRFSGATVVAQYNYYGRKGQSVPRTRNPFPVAVLSVE
ncbi:hypothetical protein IJ380_00985, partial [Candidatus Saccharibacteria bacterium]|nr:hypothetical protein [Candidatus Saccharibacteria bacterium]